MRAPWLKKARVKAIIAKRKADQPAFEAAFQDAKQYQTERIAEDNRNAIDWNTVIIRQTRGEALKTRDKITGSTADNPTYDVFVAGVFEQAQAVNPWPRFEVIRSGEYEARQYPSYGNVSGPTWCITKESQIVATARHAEGRAALLWVDQEYVKQAQLPDDGVS